MTLCENGLCISICAHPPIEASLKNIATYQNFINKNKIKTKDQIKALLEESNKIIDFIKKNQFEHQHLIDSIDLFTEKIYKTTEQQMWYLKLNPIESEQNLIIYLNLQKNFDNEIISTYRENLRAALKLTYRPKNKKFLHKNKQHAAYILKNNISTIIYSIKKNLKEYGKESTL